MRVPSHIEHPLTTAPVPHPPALSMSLSLGVQGSWQCHNGQALTVMRGKLGSLPASSSMCAGAGGTMKGPRGLPGTTLSV